MRRNKMKQTEYQKEYKKQYYQLNKKRLDAKSKAYSEAHKEELNEYQSKYYQMNKEERRLFQQQWRKTPNGIAAIKKSRLKNKEGKKQQDRRYYLRNKTKLPAQIKIPIRE